MIFVLMVLRNIWLPYSIISAHSGQPIWVKWNCLICFRRNCLFKPSYLNLLSRCSLWQLGSSLGYLVWHPVLDMKRTLFLFPCFQTILKKFQPLLNQGRRKEYKIGPTIWKEAQSNNYWSDHNSENTRRWPYITRFLVRPRSEWSDRLRRPCKWSMYFHTNRLWKRNIDSLEFLRRPKVHLSSTRNTFDAFNTSTMFIHYIKTIKTMQIIKIIWFKFR